MAQNLKKVSIYLFGLRLLRMAMSVITLVLSAKYFGISVDRDIWLLVVAFITTVNLAIWGPINETFRTKFVFLRSEEGERVALEKTSELFLFMIFVTVAISLLITIFPEFILRFLAPSLIHEQKAMFVQMLYLLIPTFIINQVTSIGISVLNAYNYFYIPEIVGFFSGILNLLCLFILAPLVGIISLVISQYLSIVLLLVVIIYYIRKQHIGIRLMHITIRWENIRPFVVFALPFFLPYFAGQCNGLLEKSLANYMGEGIVSTIDYSKKFTDILQMVLASILASVMVPTLAAHFSKKQFVNFQVDFRQHMQVVFGVLSLTVPILIGSSLSLNKFLYLRGDMLLSSVETIALLTRFYGVAFIGIAFYLLFGLTLLAQDKGRRYALYGMIAQIGMIVINVLFFHQLGIYTFVISLLITHIGVAILMFKAIHFEWRREVVFEFVRHFMILLLLIGALVVLNYFLIDMSPLVILIISGGVLFFLFLVLYELFGFHIFGYLKEKLGRLI